MSTRLPTLNDRVAEQAQMHASGDEALMRVIRSGIFAALAESNTENVTAGGLIKSKTRTEINADGVRLDTIASILSNWPLQPIGDTRLAVKLELWAWADDARMAVAA